MSQQRKLLIAAVILADLLLILVWALRDSPARSISAAPLEAESESRHEEVRATERLTAPRPTALIASSPASIVARSAKRTSVAAPARIQVRGTVYGLDGRTLLGLDVQFFARDDHRQVVEASANARADYSLEDLHAGTWTLLARADGYYDFAAKLELRAGDPVHHADIALQRRDELRVRLVTPEGGSLVERMEADGGRLEVTPFATSTMPAARLTEAQVHELALIRERLWHPPASHAESVKGFGSDIEGYLVLGEPLPSYISAVFGDTVLQTKHADTDALEVTFVLSLGDVHSAWSRVELELADLDTGKPLADAEADLDSVVGNTDGRGAIRFEDVAPGLHRLQVHAPGHEDILRTIRVEPGRTIDLGVWSLSAATSIRGRFVDVEGRAVTMYWSLVLAGGEGPPNSAAEVKFFDTVGPEHSATFEAAGLGRRKYWVSGSGDGMFAPPTLVDLSNGSRDDVVIPVSVGVAVMLRFATDEDRYVKFAIQDSKGAPVREGGSFGNRVSVFLGAGAYSVRYRIGDDPFASKSFEVDSQTKEVVIVP